MSTGTGVNVSKANAYAVLTTPSGLVATKANAYAVLTPKSGNNVTKANAYAVLVPVTSNPPVWQSVLFANGVVGASYTQQWDLSPAASPTTYTLNSGSLPPGLALSNAGGDVGRLSGIPTQTGTYTFTLLATNGYGTAVSQTLTVIVIASGGNSAWAF